MASGRVPNTSRIFFMCILIELFLPKPPAGFNIYQQTAIFDYLNRLKLYPFPAHSPAVKGYADEDQQKQAKQDI